MQVKTAQCFVLNGVVFLGRYPRCTTLPVVRAILQTSAQTYSLT